MQHNLKIQIWSIEDGEQETQTDQSKAKQSNDMNCCVRVPMLSNLDQDSSVQVDDSFLVILDPTRLNQVQKC